VRGMGWDGLMMGLYISWTYTSPFACILEYAVCYLLATSDQHGWLGREQVSSIGIRPKIYDVMNYLFLYNLINVK
jgi:hypothetical protein